MGNSSWQKTEAGTHLQSPDPLKLSDKTEEVTELRQQLTNWGLCLLLACEEHLFYVCMILVAVLYCDYSSVIKLLHFRCNFLHPWDMHFFFFFFEKQMMQWTQKMKMVQLEKNMLKFSLACRLK